MLNIVGLDDGLAPDQRQAISQSDCEIYTFCGYNILFMRVVLGVSAATKIISLISDAVCYIFVWLYLWNMHLKHVRSCQCRHSLNWFLYHRSELGRFICPHQYQSRQICILLCCVTATCIDVFNVLLTCNGIKAKWVISHDFCIQINE